MQQNQPKTQADYLSEIRQLQALIDNPQVEDHLKDIYRETIPRIRQAMEQAAVIAANPTLIHQARIEPDAKTTIRMEPPPPRTTPFPSPQGEGKGVGPNHAEGIQMDEYIYTDAAQPDTAAPHIHIVAPLGGGPKKVRIQWGDGSTITLTEGICRSRFTSALRDLCESTYAEQERYDDLRYYTSFHRACGYYRGLSALWGRQPTAREIGLGTLSRVRSTILDMIIAAAAAASQPTAS